MESLTHFSLTQPLLVQFNRELSVNLPSFILVRCDDSWVTGFWRYKGQDLNVQLYIHSFIHFKWLRWQSGLNISYTRKSLVTQISQRGLYVMRDEKKISKYNCNWNKRTVEWFIKNQNWIWRCCSASEHLLNRPDSTLVYLALTCSCWTWIVLTVQTSALCSKMCTSWNTCCSPVWR